MDFQIGLAEKLDVDNIELLELLSEVYIDGGFTSKNSAETIFEPTNVRKRGKIIGARDNLKKILAGMVISVPPNSAARRLADSNEIELHLLPVKPCYRRYGLGKLLVEAVIKDARKESYTKIILWTQPTMKAAHSLYKKLGFIPTPERNFVIQSRKFLVYEKTL